jgi:hypothetical protein
VSESRFKVFVRWVEHFEGLESCISMHDIFSVVYYRID